MRTDLSTESGAEGDKWATHNKHTIIYTIIEYSIFMFVIEILLVERGSLWLMNKIIIISALMQQQLLLL